MKRTAHRALFFAALVRLDFAIAQTILLVVPFLVLLVSGVLLGEPVSRAHYIAVAAPFRYTTLLGAVAIGSVWFDETPNATTILGCAVIVLSGVAAVRSDRRSTDTPSTPTS